MHVTFSCYFAQNLTWACLWTANFLVKDVQKIILFIKSSCLFFLIAVLLFYKKQTLYFKILVSKFLTILSIRRVKVMSIKACYKLIAKIFYWFSGLCQLFLNDSSLSIAVHIQSCFFPCIFFLQRRGIKKCRFITRMKFSYWNSEDIIMERFK